MKINWDEAGKQLFLIINNIDLNYKNVLKHVITGISLVKDLSKPDPHCIHFLTHSYNVNHILVHDIQRIISWLHFNNHLICCLLLSLFLSLNYLWYLHLRSSVSQNDLILLHSQLTNLHSRNEWFYHFSFLESYSFCWQYLR